MYRSQPQKEAECERIVSEAFHAGIFGACLQYTPTMISIV
jgi:hypothetical protein